MNNLILIRHGQSEWNLQKRFTGWVDVGLTDVGKKEAKQSGELTKKLNIQFDRFFTSFQKRAILTLEIILNVLGKNTSEISREWKLNERHYGALTGLNKDEVKKKLGKKQVHIWRRSWNIAPPPMLDTDPNHPSKNIVYSKIPLNKIPNCESLKDTYNRVIPFYEKKIVPLLLDKKNIIIAAHGNSLRAIYKKLFNISNKKITEVEIPTGNPLLINFEESLKIKKYKYLDSKRAKKIWTNI